MSIVSVEINQSQLADVRERLAHITNGTNRALSRALNRTGSQAKTLASREIRKQVRLTAAYVRENLKGPPDGWDYKALPSRLTAKVSAKRRGILLRNFVTNAASPSPGRAATPIRVKIKPAGPAEAIKSAFWVRTKNSGVVTPAVRNAVLRRLGMKIKLDAGPFTVLHGPSLSQVFTDVKDDIKDGLRGKLAANLQHEMDWLLHKYPPPGGDGADP